MSATARILTVCTGNVCRSPFLERALQAELDGSWGAGSTLVSSAGTGALEGHGMDERAQFRLEGAGYAAHGFVARQLTASMVADSDLVLTATRAHRAEVARLHPRALRYVFSFREFAELVAGAPVEQLHAGTGSAREQVVRAVALAVAQRGVRAPLSDLDADIVDPFRRSDETFDEMSLQIMAALPNVAQALGRG